MERLTGGYINNVYRVDGVVRKEFSGEGKTGKSIETRMLRERCSLNRFGGRDAPLYLGTEGEGCILQEFIPGESLWDEESVRMHHFAQAGQLLRRIHRRVVRNESYLRSAFETRYDMNFKKAKPVLEHADLNVDVNVNWQEVFELGSTWVHRDFWLGNVISQNGRMKAIDWEFSGIGSPYEDFAIVDLWIVREYADRFQGCEQEFWKGYGFTPDGSTVTQFLKARCVEFLATTTPADYEKEEEDGFYHNKVAVLKELK